LISGKANWENLIEHYKEKMFLEIPQVDLPIPKALQCSAIRTRESFGAYSTINTSINADTFMESANHEHQHQCRYIHGKFHDTSINADTS